MSQRSGQSYAEWQVQQLPRCSDFGCICSHIGYKERFGLSVVAGNVNVAIIATIKAEMARYGSA